MILSLNYKNLSIGKVLGIIGIVLSSLFLIVVIYAEIFVGEAGLKKFQDNLMEKAKYQQEQNQ